MKNNRLIEIKTAYNERGDFDKDLYFKEQRSVYENEISFATNVDTITEQQFCLKPLEIGFLNSTSLKDQQKFKDIRKIMADYNKSIIESGGSATNGLHLKKVVMDSMLKFMRLMLLAPDTSTKKVILDVSYHWFIKHLDPKSGNKSKKQLQKQIKQILVQRQLLPIDIVNKQLILNKINEQLHPYRTKARTMYKQIDDPRVQLQNYNTHKLQFMTDNSKDNKVSNQKKKWIDTVKFPKIEPLPYSIEEPEADKKQQDNQNKDVQNQGNRQVVKNEGEGQPTNIQVGPDGQPIVKEQENANEQQQADLDFGGPPDPDQQPEELQQIADDKKKGKLDPLLKVFVLQRIRAKQKEEVSCERIRRKQENKGNLTQAQEFLDGDYIREWAKQRTRFKTQVAKKNQSMRGLDKYAKGKQQDSILFLQDDLNRVRMKSTISQYKRNITTVEVPPDSLNSQPGLSLFDRRRIKTETSKKPFSSILHDHSRKAEQNLSLDEIGDIKQKFSKYKIYTPLDSIIKGLVPPDKQYVEDEGRIIWPNSQLISNPYIKVAKKKKKKKKK